MAIYLEGDTLRFTGDSIVKIKDVFYKPTSPNNPNTHIVNFSIDISGQVDIYNAWAALQAQAASEGFPDNPVPKIAVVNSDVELYTYNVSHGYRQYPTGPQMSLAVRFNMATEGAQYNTFMSQMGTILAGFIKTTSNSTYTTIDTYVR